MSDLIPITVSVQEETTREWVAQHVLLHHESDWQGCMVCVALWWGNAESPGSLSMVRLEEVAKMLKIRVE